MQNKAWVIMPVEAGHALDNRSVLRPNLLVLTRRAVSTL